MSNALTAGLHDTGIYELMLVNASVWRRKYASLHKENFLYRTFILIRGKVL